jgi:hypothetical protein
VTDQPRLFDPLNYDAALQRRDTGMEHAEMGAAPEFSEAARTAIFHLPPGTEFLAEEIRAHLASIGITTRDCRALGPVIMGARKEGLIVAVGAGRAKTSNLSLKPLWQRTAKPYV